MIKKNCLKCGKEFTCSVFSSQKYCSTSCFRLKAAEHKGGGLSKMYCKRHKRKSVFKDKLDDTQLGNGWVSWKGIYNKKQYEEMKRDVVKE